MRLDNRLALSLIAWCCERADQAGLSTAEVTSAPAIPTVYILTDATGTVPFYVGQSNMLRRRLLAHNQDPKKIEAGWDGTVRYLVPGVESTDLRLEIETHLILCLRPELNKGVLLNCQSRRLTEIRWNRKGRKRAKGAAA